MIVLWTNKGQFLIEKKNTIEVFPTNWLWRNFEKRFQEIFHKKKLNYHDEEKKTHKKELTDDDFSLSPNFYFLPVSLSIIFATKYSRPFDEIFWPLSLSALPLPVAACPWKIIFCTLISWLLLSVQQADRSPEPVRTLFVLFWKTKSCKTWKTWKMNVTGVKTVKSLPKMPQQQQTNFNLSTKVISGKKLQLSKNC